jgi:hypothetical protein
VQRPDSPVVLRAKRFNASCFTGHSKNGIDFYQGHVLIIVNGFSCPKAMEAGFHPA